MRLLHVADLHGGLLTHSRPDPDSGLPSRVVDVARCWHEAAELGVKEAVDVAILAGDVFQTPNPSAGALTGFGNGLRVLEENGIPTVIIPGNHDRAPHPNQECVLQVFSSDFVHVVERPEVVEIEGIRIACLPSVSPHLLMAKRQGIARSELVQALVDGLVTVLGDLRTQSPDVLTLHWTVEGSVLSTGRDVQIIGPGDPVLPLAELEGPWRYVAAGHIHKAQAIGDLGWYSGSVDRMSFGEEHEDKLALLVDVDEKEAHVTPHVLHARRFVTITDQTLDLRPDELALEGAIVRLKLGAEHAGAVDGIRRDAYSAGAEIVTGGAEVTRELRARAEHVTESLGHEEAIEAWFDAKAVPDEERPPLRETAKQIAEEAGG